MKAKSRPGKASSEFTSARYACLGVVADRRQAALGPGDPLIEKAETILVSPISLFEIGQKVRLGKCPEMQPFVGRLPDLLQEQGAIAAALTPDVCLAAAMMDWAHRDPFDRFLAATAMENGIPIISADGVFDELIGNQLWIARFW